MKDKKKTKKRPRDGWGGSKKTRAKQTTALATRAPDRALTRVERAEVASDLDQMMGKRGEARSRKINVVQALARAAEVLAPHFAVSAPFVDAGALGGGVFGGQIPGERPLVENTALLVEILCSAGAWLALSRNIPKDELLQKFQEWMTDQGYE